MISMNSFTINTTSAFEEELQNIVSYIYFFLKEPKIAIKLYKKIINKISSLEFLPEHYSKIHYKLNSHNLTLRKLPIDNFVIIYEVNNLTHQIFILHIFHCNQNYLNLL